ncbi:MAG: glycosyltransferase family 4 protein [Gemmatimonadota bacterium]
MEVVDGLNMYQVVILNRVVCDYRRRFHLELRRSLKGLGIELTLLAGAPRKGEFLVDDLEEAGGVRGKNKHLMGKPYWTTGAVEAATRADLVILEQANAALHNYWLLVSRRLRRKPRRTAFWGHGYSVDALGGQPVRTAWKRHIATKVDWWFAYTPTTTTLLESWGYPPSQITTVNNSIDTRSLRAHAHEGSDADQLLARHELFGGDSGSGPLGVYCGRLTANKEIPFLLQTIGELHRERPDFRFVLIGDGPFAAAVREFQRGRTWFRWVGPMHGPERARIISLADVWLNPGGVGLGVLDAFSVGVPMATTSGGMHGPEFAYLKDGFNGVVTEHSILDFAAGVLSLLANPARLASLQSEAWESGKRYSSEDMASRFTNGILACLGTPDG